jgi:hypothetical protein
VLELASQGRPWVGDGVVLCLFSLLRPEAVKDDAVTLSIVGTPSQGRFPPQPGNSAGRRCGMTPVRGVVTKWHELTSSGVVAWVANLAEARPEFVNAVDGAGRTMLHRAAEKGNLGVMKLLVALGADLEARCAHGSTVLGLATKGDDAIVRWLGLRGADVHARCVSGVTQLLVAVGRRDVRMIRTWCRSEPAMVLPPMKMKPMFRSADVRGGGAGQRRGREVAAHLAAPRVGAWSPLVCAPKVTRARGLMSLGASANARMTGGWRC